jgi:hypothetical protein
MMMSELVTESDLARARRDPEFRQRFYADNLDRLLEKLNQMRKSGTSEPTTARLIKEGVELAVKLADRLNTKANVSRDSSGQAA